jgi:hypothetical protein
MCPSCLHSNPTFVFLDIFQHLVPTSVSAIDFKSLTMSSSSSVCDELESKIKALLAEFRASVPKIVSRPKLTASAPTDKPWRAPSPPTQCSPSPSRAIDKPWRSRSTSPSSPSAAKSTKEVDKPWRSRSPSSPAALPAKSTKGVDKPRRFSSPPSLAPRTPRSPRGKGEVEICPIKIIWDAKIHGCPPPSPSNLKPFFPCPPDIDIPGSRQTKLSPPHSPKGKPRSSFPISLPPSSPKCADPLRNPHLDQGRVLGDLLNLANVGPSRLAAPIPSPQTCFVEPWMDEKNGPIVVNLTGNKPIPDWLRDLPDPCDETSDTFDLNSALEHGVCSADHPLLQDVFTTALCDKLRSGLDIVTVPRQLAKIWV